MCSLGGSVEHLIRKELREVFGSGIVSPSGTGVVLTSPSKLSYDLVSATVEDVSLEGMCYHIGHIAAQVIADALEQQGLKTSDYANVPDVSKIMAKRIAKEIHASEPFQKGLVEGMLRRG
jgi:hypothetical protein